MSTAWPARFLPAHMQKRLLVRLFVAFCFLAAALPAFASTTTTDPPDPPDPPPIPVVTSGGWSRDFNGPLDDNFLALGFKFRGGFYESDGQLQVAPTFQRSTEGGVLALWDDTLPADDGAHTALAADFSMAFDKVHISGTINPLGLPVIPDGSPITGENSLGFIARGDLTTMSTYYAAVDFRDGTLRMGDVIEGQVYFADHLASRDEMLSDDFDDYKSRSYFLEFSVETYAGQGSGSPSLPLEFADAETGDVLLASRLYDHEGGELLMSLYWVDKYEPIRAPGVAGVFVQSFEQPWQDADLHPALFGSFDDVTAVVPEPSAWLLAVLGVGGLFTSYVRNRRTT